MSRRPGRGLACWAQRCSLRNSDGRARAARAVGGAVGKNPIAFLIPCHRVVRKAGGIGGYHWGPARKRAMLAWEAAKARFDNSEMD